MKTGDLADLKQDGFRVVTSQKKPVKRVVNNGKKIITALWDLTAAIKDYLIQSKSTTNLIIRNSDELIKLLRAMISGEKKKKKIKFIIHRDRDGIDYVIAEEL